MIKDIREINFPEYATLDQATATINDMGDRSISAQVKIDGSVVPDFSFDWEVEFKGERYIHPVREPQGLKDNTSRRSKIDLTFHHWAIYEMKREYFVEMASTTAGTAIADKYIASLGLNLGDFVTAFNLVLNHYFGGKIVMKLNPDWQYGTEASFMAISYSYIWDVLQQMHEIYGVRWTIKTNAEGVCEILMGYPAEEVSHIFEYGFEGGLLSVQRQVQNAEIRNRLLGRGGDKNLPYRYFKDKDPNNPLFEADPDWVPELANIAFTELRGKTFRDYIKGWKAKRYNGSVMTQPTEAYLAGYNASKFDPIEYVEDKDSIEKYGVLVGALENNEEIYPSIQGAPGNIDAIVDAEQVADDDVDSAVENDSVTTNLESGHQTYRNAPANSTVTIETLTKRYFSVPEGKVGNLSMSLTATGKYSDFGDYEETYPILKSDTVKVTIHNKTTGAEIKSSSVPVVDIPAGDYYYMISADVETNYDRTSMVTLNIESVYLYTSTPDKSEGWKQTFDIWVRNIWNSSRNAGETDQQYADRVWAPILGDRMGGEARVVFTSGWLSFSSDWEFPIVGYAFDNSKSGSEWKLTLAKSEAELEASGKYIPYEGYNASAGDRFFFIGIDMPYEYVTWAEERLDNYKRDALLQTANINPTWVIKTDKVRLNQERINEKDEKVKLIDGLNIGSQIRLASKQFISDAYETLYVQSMTYSWQADTLLHPDIEIVVSDKVASVKNPVAQIQSSIESIQRQVGNLSNIQQIIRQICDKLYLRKDGFSDISKSPTRFLGKISGENFRPGQIGGRDWGIYRDENGNAILEADKFVARQGILVNELIVSEATYVGGLQINSAASMNITVVEEIEDGYVCFFDQKQGSVTNKFVVDDVVLCQRFDADQTVVKFYKARVTAVSEDSVTLSKTEVNGTGIPAVDDAIIQYGNYSDKTRQYVIVRDVIGGGYERMLMGLDSVESDGVEYYFAGKSADSTARWFVGGTEQFAKYEDGQLTIKGNIFVTGSDKNVSEQLAQLDFIRETFGENAQGLILGTAIIVGYSDENENFVPMAGLSGVYDKDAENGGPAAWYGGTPDDAKSVIFMDGTGYFADGLFKWDKDKGVNLGDGAIKINYDGSVEFGGNIKIGGTGEETLDSLLTLIAKLTAIWGLGEDGVLSTNKKVQIENDLLVEGDVASGGAGGGSASVGITGILVNGKTYTDDNGDGVIDLGTITSGLTSVDWSDVKNKPTFGTLAYKNGLTASEVGALSTSGGTIKSSVTNPLAINSTSGTQSGLVMMVNDAAKGWFGWDNGGVSIYSYASRKSLGILDNGTPYYDDSGNKYTLIHSGNVGSQSVASASNISSQTPLLAVSTESNAIHVVDNANYSITTNAPNTAACISKAISFAWYDTNWQIGNIRGSSSNSEGFGITNGNSKLCFRVTDDAAYVGVNTVIHSGNYSDYALPLSGGTIDGSLQIGKDDNTSYKHLILSRSSHAMRLNNVADAGYISFGAYSGGVYTAEKMFEIGDYGLRYSANGGSTYYTLLHSGNIGSYAFIPRDAISSNTDANNLQNGVYLNGTGNGTGNSNFPQLYSIISHFTQSDRYQSQISIGNPNVYVRRKIDTWSEWVELITNKNIGSQRTAGFRVVDHYANIDVNTALRGGGVTSNYSVVGSVTNAPSGSSYGSIVEFASGFGSGDGLAGQLAWDVNHRGTDTTRFLWWRASDDRGFANAKWHQIAFTDSDITGKAGGLRLAKTTDLNKIPTDMSSYAIDYVQGTSLNAPANHPYGFLHQYKWTDGNWHSQLYFTVSDFGNKLYSRGYRDDTKEWTAWREFAFTDSNVASAQAVMTSDNKYLVQFNASTLYVGGGTYSAYSTQILGNDVRLRYGANADIGLFLNSSGNVTIGNSDLAGTEDRLYVNGSTRLVGNLQLNPTSGVFLSININSSRGGIQAMHDGVAFLPIALNPNGGNVGIGTNNPSYKLDVAGTARITGKTTISNDLVVSGDVSTGGSGENTGAAGTVTGIAVNGQTYMPTAGIVTIPDYPTSLTWSAIEGKPTTIDGYGITDSIKFINAQTYVGARFADSELNRLAASSFIECWSSAGYWNWLAGKFIVAGGTSSQFLKADGSLDGTSYLSTSGGTISGVLTISTNIDKSLVLDEPSGEKYHIISFAANGQEYANLTANYLGNENSLWFNNAKILHSGNIGDYKAGDSDKLGGIGLITEVTDWNGYQTSIFKSSQMNTTNAPTTDFCYGLQMRFHRSVANFYTDLATALYSDKLYYRRHTEQGFGDWKTLAFTDSDITGNAATATKATQDGNGNVITSTYLPKSGGTIKGTDTTPLIIKSGNSEYSVVKLMSSDDNFITLGYKKGKGLFATNENGWSSENFLIHSGNIGSYAVGLDGSNARATWLTSSENLDSYKYGFYSYANGNNPTNSFGTNAALFAFTSCRGNDTWQIAFDGNGIINTTGPVFCIRGNFANQGWTSWYRIATTESNVASATKLATARTIWGQSFDGSNDVSVRSSAQMGLLYFTNNDGNAGSYIGRGSTLNNDLITYVETSSAYKLYTGGSLRMLINSSGNVTIGGSDLASTTAKLYVDGAVALFEQLNFTRQSWNYITAPSTSGNLAFNIGAAGIVNTKMCILNNGHVLIGTTTDAGYRLYVDGTARIADAVKFAHTLSVEGAVTMSSTLSVAGATTINGALTAGATTINGNLIVKGDVASA